MLAIPLVRGGNAQPNICRNPFLPLRREVGRRQAAASEGETAGRVISPNRGITATTRFVQVFYLGYNRGNA